jgi:hypothetical protein
MSGLSEIAILTDSSIKETFDPLIAIEEAIRYPSVLRPYTATEEEPVLKVSTELPRSSLRYTSCDLQKVFPLASGYKLCLKIWFDILTPKQVMFFRRAVSLLRNSGHDVLCTSRQYREAIELARIKKLDLSIVGSHGGADRYDKLRQSASRTYELAEAVRRFGPDVAVNFSSPEGARLHLA